MSTGLARDGSARTVNGQTFAFEDLPRMAGAMADRLRNQHEIVEQRRLDYEEAAATEKAIRMEIDRLLLALESCSAALISVDGVVESAAQKGGLGERCGGEGDSGVVAPSSHSVYPLPETAPNAELSVFMLGSFRLFRNGRPVVSWPGTRTPRIVRRIAAHRGRPVPREILIDLFWPEADVETGRRNLHQAIYQIRSMLRDDRDAQSAILYENDAYSMDGRLGVWCDADVFEANIEAGRAAMRDGRISVAIEEFRAAETRYLGDYLEDTPYEDWCLTERTRLRQLYLGVANQLADLYLDDGDCDSALHVTNRVLTREPSDERAHRSAMRCYALKGQRSLLVRQYQTCTEVVVQECGLNPSCTTTSLYTALLDQLNDHDDHAGTTAGSATPGR